MPAAWLKVPVPVYPGVPPPALTVTVERSPLQAIAVWDEVASTALGCVMSPVVVAVQLLASVTV